VTIDQFEDAMNTYKLDDQYAEYIENQVPIGNNHMLVHAMESGQYYEGFRESLVDQCV